MSKYSLILCVWINLNADSDGDYERMSLATEALWFEKALPIRIVA